MFLRGLAIVLGLAGPRLARCASGRFMPKLVSAVLAVLLGSAPLVGAQEHGFLTGTVRDTAGVAIAGAEVVLGTRRLQTTQQGRFQVDSLPVGSHFITIRMVGYTALRTPVTIRRGLNQHDYTLQATVQSLPTLNVEAPRTGLYGTVVDSAFTPLAGARVRVAGRGGGEVLTDSAGRFAFPRTADGQYAVRIVLPGYAAEQRFIELRKAEGMEIVVRLRTSREFATRADDVAIQELGRRLVTNLRTDRLNAAELERYGTLGLCDLPGFVSRLRASSEGLTIILNGTTIFTNMPTHTLCSWRAAEVELIEFGDTVCRDATRTLMDLLNVWCQTINKRRGDLTRAARLGTVGGANTRGNPVQRPPGPFVVIWERR